MYPATHGPQIDPGGRAGSGRQLPGGLVGPDQATRRAPCTDAPSTPRATRGEPRAPDRAGRRAGASPRVAADPRTAASWRSGPPPGGPRAPLRPPTATPIGDEVLLSARLHWPTPDVALDAAEEAPLVWGRRDASPRPRSSLQRFTLAVTPSAASPSRAAPRLPRSALAAAPDGGFAGRLGELGDRTIDAANAVWARRFDPVTRRLGDRPADFARRLRASTATFPGLPARRRLRLLVWTTAARPLPGHARRSGAGASGARPALRSGSSVRLSHQRSIEPVAVAVDRDGNTLVVAGDNGSSTAPDAGIYATLFDRSWHPRPSLCGSTTSVRPPGAARRGGAARAASSWSGRAALTDPTVPGAALDRRQLVGIFGQRSATPGCAAGSDGPLPRRRPVHSPGWTGEPVHRPDRHRQGPAAHRRHRRLLVLRRRQPRADDQGARRPAPSTATSGSSTAPLQRRVHAHRHRHRDRRGEDLPQRPVPARQPGGRRGVPLGIGGTGVSRRPLPPQRPPVPSSRRPYRAAPARASACQGDSTRG